MKQAPTHVGYLFLAIPLLLPAGAGAQSPSRGSLAPAYVLHIDLRRPSQGLSLEGTVQLPPQGMRRETLEMTLRSDMQLLDVRVLRPRASAGPVRLEAVDSVAAPALTTVWRLGLRTPIAAGEEVELAFRSRGGAQTTLNFHLGAEVAFAGGGTTPWYPQFGGSRGVGRNEFRLPSGWRVQASGKLAPSRGGNPSAYQVTDPTEFGFVAGPFQEHSRRFGDMRVKVLLLEKRPFADELAGLAARTIGVLEREFGPYPYSDFAIVEIPTGPAKQSGFVGAAYAGYMLVRSDFLVATKADAGHFGHEIGHQWWGVSVQRRGDAGDYMLDEALAQYGALRAVEEISGAEAAAKFRSGKEGLGGEDKGLRLIAAGFTYPLGHLPHEPAAYELSDAKGYLIYDLLSRTIGADRLRSALGQITREYRNREVSWDEFLRHLQDHAQQDLDWFYKQWFDRGDAPIVDLRWRRDNNVLRVTVLQRGYPYRLALPVVVKYADGSSQVHWIDIFSDSTTVALPAHQPVVRVLLDPQNLVFHATTDEWNRARSLAPFTRGLLLWDNGDAEGAKAAFLGGLDSVPVPDLAGLEFLLRLHIGWIAEEAGQPDKAMQEYGKASELAVRPPEMLARLYWNVTKLSRQRGELGRARWAAAQVLAAEAVTGKESQLAERARKALEETISR